MSRGFPGVHGRTCMAGLMHLYLHGSRQRKEVQWKDLSFVSLPLASEV
jgi:hypothetical protein